MTEPRVIQADFANWRPVAGRKCLQLIFEVPIEQTETVIKMLGVPIPGESKWCAVALLENGRSANESGNGQRKSAPKPPESTAAPGTQIGGTPLPINANTADGGTSETPSRERRPFSSLPLSQQCAIRCGDQDFAIYLQAKWLSHWKAAKGDIVKATKILCDCTSRKELDVEGTPARRWRDVERDFQAFLTDRQYAESVR